jgi:hypothetical protein
MALPAHLARLDTLDEAWRAGPAGLRLERVRAAAPRLKERIAGSGRATSVRTADLITLPYPTSFGLGDAARSLLPYLMITNRMQVVTFETDEGPKRLLVNPSDHERDAETPFFKRLASAMPELVNRLVARRHGTVPGRLAEWGLRGEQIHYVTYDHLHTQDLRRVLLEWCPNAKLLVMDRELEIFQRLHPLQTDWFQPDALDGVPAERIVALDGDYLLGAGVALVRTPGHTLGNHTIVLHTDGGMWTISENGVSVDNYAPERSAIRGLGAHARSRGVEVILNANTREHSLDQYTAMILEKGLCDPRPDGFLLHFPSSELTAHPLLPGLRPTYSHGAITHGPAPV